MGHRKFFNIFTYINHVDLKIGIKKIESNVEELLYNIRNLKYEEGN